MGEGGGGGYGYDDNYDNNGFGDYNDDAGDNDYDDHYHDHNGTPSFWGNQSFWYAMFWQLNDLFPLVIFD